ncbi:MAG: hypothetical protein M1823_000232 [Watsoniomyces obsoletus]|nr:MAG: hypothetical protein M1823_000232 [Watsoniomyces obsoletus]
MSGATSTNSLESPDGPSSQITPQPSTDSSEIAAASSVSKMAILTRKLEELNMVQYLPDFVEAGFEEWEILCDIRESDLDALNVKLGHRRRLQRRIASERGLASTGAIPSERDLRKPASPEGASMLPEACTSSGGRPHAHKRKYVRHPKPDPNAPKRALSAYATFANDQRRLHDYSTWSFPDIAKQIGELWRSLGADEKERYHAQAALAKEDYAKQMAVYKTTEAYRQYQEYLTGWKADQARKSAKGKGMADGVHGHEKPSMEEGSETSSPPGTMLDGERSTLDDWTASMESRSSSPVDGGSHRWLPPIEPSADYSPISPTSSASSMRPGARLDAALLGPPLPHPHQHHHRPSLHPPTTQPGPSSWQGGGIWSSSWQDTTGLASYPPTSSAAGDLRNNNSPWPSSGMNGHPSTFGGSGPSSGGSGPGYNPWSNRHTGT